TASEQFDPGLVDLTIGEVVTYRLTLTLPEGTSSLNLTDTLPTMFQGTIQFFSASVVSIGANISGSALAVGDTGTVNGPTINFNFGRVVNAEDNVSDEKDQIIVDVSGGAVNVPKNVSGVRAPNVAFLDYGWGTVTDTATVDIVEPKLD